MSTCNTCVRIMDKNKHQLANDYCPETGMFVNKMEERECQKHSRIVTLVTKPIVVVVENQPASEWTDFV